MLSTVTIDNVSASDAIGFKHQLEADGLIMHQDFIWHYSPVKYDQPTGDSSVSNARFDFANPSLASFYRVKWTR